MADTEGSLILPKRITLGNALSMVVTIASAAVVLGVLYGTFGARLTSAESTIKEFPSTYAKQVDLDRVQKITENIASDQKTAASTLQEAIANVLAKIGETNVTLATQNGSLAALRDSVADIKDALKERPLPRRQVDQ